MSDLELLQRYVRQHDEHAFAELVHRHLDWVYSSALRQVQDAHLAEDVTQAVFLALSQQASRLQKGVVLPAWLLQVTRRASAMATRSAVRRRTHEQKASSMRSEESSTPDAWQRIAPVLDELVASLSKTNRLAILLRFYQGNSWPEVGQALGLSEEAARKRVARALEKLKVKLEAKDLMLGSATVLATVLSGNTTQAAPVGLTSIIVSNAAAPSMASATVMSLSKGATTMMTWAKAKVVAAILFVAFLASGDAIFNSTIAGQPDAEKSHVDAAPVPQPAGLLDIDAAALVREVRESESWVDEVKSLRLRLDVKFIRTERGLEDNRDRLQSWFPDAELTPEKFIELRPQDVDRKEIAFDRQRIYERTEPQHGKRGFNVRFWDGKRGISHSIFMNGKELDEQYALYDELLNVHEGQSYSIHGISLGSMGWLRAGPHDYWWQPKLKDARKDRTYGRPEDFILTGREMFNGVECYVLKCKPAYRSLYVGVKDHRLCGIAEGLNRETPIAVFRLSEYREVAPDCWIPMRQEQDNYDEQGRSYIASQYEIDVTEAIINQPLPDEMFVLELKEGILLNDYGHDPPLSYKYKKDFSADEWQQILDQGQARQQEREKYEKLSPREREEAQRRAERDATVPSPATAPGE